MIFDEQVHDERDEAVAQLAQMLKDGARAHAAWPIFDVTWRERIESGLSRLAAQLVDAAQVTYGARTHMAAEQQAPEAGWIEWTGGACPVPADTLVDVQHRDGHVFHHNTALRYYVEDQGDGHAHDWIHSGVDGDIVAYRLSGAQS